MSKTDPLAAAKAAETEAAQTLFAEAQDIEAKAKDLRARLKAAKFEFAGPAKVAETAERTLNGSVRPSRETRIAERKARAAAKA